MRQLLTFDRREPAGLPLRAVGAGSHDPDAQTRGGQIQIAGDGPYRLAFLQDEPDSPRPELLTEHSPLAATSVVGHAGHRIPLWEDVHENGSSPVGRPSQLSWLRPRLDIRARKLLFRNVENGDRSGLIREREPARVGAPHR